MMQFSRSIPLIGEKGLQKLNAARVAVFGIGGVGGYVVEALARSGVGVLDLIDGDKVSLTNLNRQIVALHSTLGEYKVAVMAKRVLDINPNAVVNTYPVFYGDNCPQFDFSSCDYVVDAIDDVSAKIALISASKQAGAPVISCMGAGNKWDGTAFEVTDIAKTSVCPLARVMRKALKERGIEKVKVVYSKEEPKTGLMEGGKVLPASLSFVPPAAGLLLASEVIKDILSK
ncbi:MAG: tRNA threonylcarbamoyladenosine dehydratase [Clostridia bacterium]|nr:tRNA threonylcarbamoyladenosine dehydratase [Clostridia bacterium]